MTTMINQAHPTLRLTPSNSPFTRNTSPRSPTRNKNIDEPGLRLRKVIGTTTSFSNGFDTSAECFAYTAGAAAVVAAVDQDLNVTQKFFRARSAQISSARDVPGGYTGSPSPLEPKHRTLRDSVAGSPLSSSVNGRDWDSPSGRSMTARDRVKAATSVALSPNGKWIAFGETGYKPRILIFSLADGSSETPVASLCEHAHGVHCLKFSPDSKYLASLGAVHDGYLFVWSIHDRTGAADLFASNKITTPVSSIAWLGRSLITVGLRYIKVWRPDDDAPDYRPSESTSSVSTPRQKGDTIKSSDFRASIFSPRHKTLQGKNTLLNDLKECNFVAILPIGSNRAIICAESGEVCLLDDTDRLQMLESLGAVEFNITAARVENDRLFLLGPGKRSRSVPLSNISEQLAAKAAKSKRQTTLISRLSFDEGDTIVATAIVGDVIVTLSKDCAVTLARSGQADTTQLPAHRDAILGVNTIASPALPLARFFTFSSNGTILFWDHAGSLASSLILNGYDAPESQAQQSNKLKSVLASCCGRYLVAGDKIGSLMLIDIDTHAIVSRVRAHSAEIMQIHTAMIRGTELVATAGKDRSVQLFMRRNESLELLQTCQEHASSVNGVLIDAEGERLLSHSQDRTVVVREALFSDDDARPMLFDIERTIALKNSPLDISLTHDGQLFVATTDRHIARYNLRSGQCMQTFKCTDNDGGEAVAMSKLLYLPSLNGTPCIAGVCSADKSVRLYADYGALMARDWGHTEGVTDVAVFQTEVGGRDDIVTVAADSTIFIWSTESGKPQRIPSANGSTEVHEAQPEQRLGPPMRRVISHSELSKFSRRRSTEGSKSSSPTGSAGQQSSSPQPLRKKTSRMSIAQPPRLEPSDLSRRRGSRQRSPSPPSPRSVNRKRESMRRKSMAALRTKSAESVVKDVPPLPFSRANGLGLGTTTDSISRTLRSYRKKLDSSNDDTAPAMHQLREIEKELKLTLQSINERSPSKTAPATLRRHRTHDGSDELRHNSISELDEMDFQSKNSSIRSISSLPFTATTSDTGRGSESDSIVGAMEAVSLDDGSKL